MTSAVLGRLGTSVLRRLLNPHGFAVAIRRRLTADGAMRLVFVLFVAVHAVKVFRVVPLAGVADGEPIVPYAHGAVYVDIVRDRTFQAAGTGFWGYDPRIAGGVPVGL